MILVYRYRVKSLSGLLNKQSRAVNFVWNYCNDRQKDAIKWGRKWLSYFDLNKLTSGSSKELGLLSGTIDMVCHRYTTSRMQAKKQHLRYRGKRCLGWVPVKGREIKREGDAFRFGGNTFRVFYSRPLPEGKIRDGSNFAQDARGNWFLNLVIEVASGATKAPASGVGVDLGLKDFAVLSNGEKVDNPRHWDQLSARLAKAHRAHKRRLIKKIYVRMANSRRDFHHKLSTRIVREFDYIAVGNISSSGLGKTSMAKSVFDAGWSSFRYMLRYKAIAHGAWYEEVDESFTTQTCSNCGALPDSRPRGIAGLGIREWICSACGAAHDRDVNAAINILRRGRATLAEGILSLRGEDDVKLLGRDTYFAAPAPGNTAQPTKTQKGENA